MTSPCVSPLLRRLNYFIEPMNLPNADRGQPLSNLARLDVLDISSNPVALQALADLAHLPALRTLFVADTHASRAERSTLLRTW